MMQDRDHTRLFSDRVSDYSKYRPGYPQELIRALENAISLSENSVIADIGSGTGLSSELFLRKGNVVYGVEPNQEMRNAQESLTKQYPKFNSIAGAAEETTLPDDSIDVIFSGQAFHWFDKEKCKREFSRILKSTGNTVLAWNYQNMESEFQREYDQILQTHIEDFELLNKSYVSEDEIQLFFKPKQTHKINLSYTQEFDLLGLKGRLLSTSFCPKEGKIHNIIMSELESLFSKFEQDGVIQYEYKTVIYWS